MRLARREQKKLSKARVIGSFLACSPRLTGPVSRESQNLGQTRVEHLEAFLRSFVADIYLVLAAMMTKKVLFVLVARRDLGDNVVNYYV